MQQETADEVVVLGALEGAEHGRPGNVAAFESNAEDVVVGKERWEEIHRLRAAGVSVSQIARSSGLDRKTVRRALAQTAWQPYRRAPAQESLLSPHRAWLAERAPQVDYSARILFQELRRERGYGGSYQTVRDAVRPLRVEAAAGSLTQCRFETEPGEQAQADWGEVARALRGEAGEGAHLRPDARLLAPRLGRGLRARTHGIVAGGARARLRALRRAAREILLTTACAPCSRAARGGQALERDLPGLRPALGLTSRGCAGPTGRRPRARSRAG